MTIDNLPTGSEVLLEIFDQYRQSFVDQFGTTRMDGSSLHMQVHMYAIIGDISY